MTKGKPHDHKGHAHKETKEHEPKPKEHAKPKEHEPKHGEPKFEVGDKVKVEDQEGEITEVGSAGDDHHYSVKLTDGINTLGCVPEATIAKAK